MNKRKIAAVAAAAVITAKFAAASVFAADANKTYYYSNGVYFEDSSSAIRASNGSTWTETATGDRIPSNTPTAYYSPNTNKFYVSENAAKNDGAYDTTVVYYTTESRISIYDYGNVRYTGDTYNGSSSSYRSASYPYYSSWTNRYYPSYNAALSASGGRSGYVYDYTNYYYNTAYGWYSSLTGQYYSTRESALAASGWNGDYVFYRGYNTVTPTTINKKGELYYSSVTQTYFSNYSSALAASNGNPANVRDMGYIADSVHPSAGTYYSSHTNSYYPNYASALYASNYETGKVAYVGGSST
ncbi:MAG: hypothetical protein J6X85_02390, partial [Ruminococcus sp.]|nr:hypothetical protein [Ruminococcus sp.]